MEPPKTNALTVPFRVFAPRQILRLAASELSKSVVGAQDERSAE